VLSYRLVEFTLFRLLILEPICLTGPQEALYLARHAFQVDGYSEEERAELLYEPITFCTQYQFVYSHNWSVGDVLMWDQRAVMHRGTPWPYGQPRKLSSICSTTQEKDGLASIRL
jgi:alpha-ketoglutarate-dependent 2,4-dichlorophenoxyacetate dioxygenase